MIWKVDVGVFLSYISYHRNKMNIRNISRRLDYLLWKKCQLDLAETADTIASHFQSKPHIESTEHQRARVNRIRAKEHATIQLNAC